jgi:hypothetical protein
VGRLELGRWVRRVGELYSKVHYILFEDEDHEFCVNEVYGAVIEMGLVGVWDMKPILKGSELAAMLGIEVGKGLKDKMEELMDWQLEHPVGTADDYRGFIISRNK